MSKKKREKEYSDLCPSSGRPIPSGGVVYCVCDRMWKGQEYVPLHDTNGHPQTVEKIKKMLDRAYEVAQRKKAEMARREQDRKDEFAIAMIEIEKRKMIGRARRGIPSMTSRVR